MAQPELKEDDSLGKFFADAAEAGNARKAKQIFETDFRQIHIKDLEKLRGSEPLLVYLIRRRWNYDGIKFLIEEKKVDVNATERDYDYTPLMFAAMRGEAEICEWLIDNGADVETRTEDGRTALFIAVEAGALRVCRVLVERGKARVNASIGKGFFEDDTPLIRAAGSGFTDVCAYLADHVETSWLEVPAKTAFRRERFDTVTVLCWKGANLSLVVHDGRLIADCGPKLAAYFRKRHTRRILMDLVSVITLKRLGKHSHVKLLTLYLIRMLFPLLEAV